MRLLITGGAGFIGSSLARHLIQKDIYEIYVVDNLSKGLESNVPASVNFICMDLSIEESFSSLPTVDMIIHLCGQSSGERSFEDLKKDLESNYLSTTNIIRFAINRGIKKILFSSSMSIYGDGDLVPKTPYGINKLASEYLLKTHSKEIQHCILRLNNVYGPGQDLDDLKQGMVSIFLAQALKRGKILVKGSLDRQRDFVFIEDVVELIEYIILNQLFENHTIDVNSGEVSTVGNLIDEISSLIRVSDITVISGTRGDQFQVASKPDTFKLLMDKSSTRLKEGLNNWITSLKK